MSKNSHLRNINQDTIDAVLLGYKFNNSTIKYNFCIGDNFPRLDNIPGKTVVGQDTESRFQPQFFGWQNVAAIEFVYEPANPNPNLCIARANFTDINFRGVTDYDVRGNPPSIHRAQVLLRDEDINDDYLPGGIPYWVAFHEFGHAIGLYHPFYEPSYPQKPILPPSEEHTDFTLMSYTAGRYSTTHFNPISGQYDLSPVTPMLYDIAAAQQLYDPNPNYMSGSTTYRYDPSTGSITVKDGDSPTIIPLPGKIRTIWDAHRMDKEDTFDFSAAPSGVTIDLREGLNPDSDPDNTGKLTPYTSAVEDHRIFIASGAKIEKGIGSDHADTLIGGDSTTSLEGKKGNDSLFNPILNHPIKFHFTTNDGQDTVESASKIDDIYFNGEKLTGVARPDELNPGLRWAMVNNDGTAFILTRADESGAMSQDGNNLIITLNQAADEATNSIALKHLSF